ncbi:hypothetical protein GX50_07269 [[Emmonsia] crescens]|uniref:Uncharacterized protein n=1 Tax=[Emmonsia] crescens TaxID=73230 RepID=A0A2B7Z9S2_9EURO|nr:hypothetical protein GX50_07269 [Emmonsia crescens]
MPANTCHSKIPTACKKTPTTIRLSLHKLPKPMDIDGDEEEEEENEKNEEDIETQLEDSRFPQSPILQILTPELEISFRLYKHVVVNGMKDHLKNKLQNIDTGIYVSFYMIQQEAKNIVNAWLMTQNDKKVDSAGCTAVIPSEK